MGGAHQEAVGALWLAVASRPSKVSLRQGGLSRPYLHPDSQAIVEAVCAAADGLGFAPLEVALAWVRDTPGITSAIVGARTGAQLRGILKSEEISLPDVVRSALDEVSAL